MWHTAEIVKIFEKMTEGYGYDIYQNRKLCVALCNDLFADYTDSPFFCILLCRCFFKQGLERQ